MISTSAVRIDAMTLDDIPAVLEIERLSFRTPWPANAFREELTTNRMARYVVARVGDQVAGYAGLWVVIDEGHVTTFGVHPSWRRLRIGQRMLLHLADLTTALGARRMTLEVRASNEAAKALYATFGFAQAGLRRAYYSDDGEDAIVMSTPPLDDPGQRELLDAFRERLAAESLEESSERADRDR